MKMLKILFAVACACGAVPSNAQTPVDDAWRFQVILYGYLPDLGGTIIQFSVGARSALGLGRLIGYVSTETGSTAL